MISSALPDPINKAASGALRLQVTRATGFIPAVFASKDNSSSSPSKFGAPKSTPTKMVGVLAVAGSAVKLSRETLTFLTTGQGGPTTQEASGVSPPDAERLTARPGTIVEMACLYTICVTVLRSNTTYWSKDST